MVRGSRSTRRRTRRAQRQMDAVFDDESVESDRGSTPIGEKDAGDYARREYITNDAEKQ